MSELPESWEIISLQSCIYFQEGPGLRKWQFGDTGVHFLNIRTFHNGYINRSRCQFVKLEEFTGKYEHFLLQEGDIVVSSSGTIGKIAVVRQCDLPLMLNTSTIRFRSLYPDHLSQDYLKVYLQSQHFFDQINSATTGSAISNYGPSHLKQMEIVVPPLNEQRRIVAKLEKLLAKCEACKQRFDKIPGILKRFRQSILAAACSGRLTADWREQDPDLEPALTLLKKAIDACRQEYETQKMENKRVEIPSCLRTYEDSQPEWQDEVPEDWAVIPFGKLIEKGPQNGLYKPQLAYGKGTLIVRIDSFYDGEVHPWITLNRLEASQNEVALYSLENKDILVNRVNSMKFLGKSALVYNVNETCVFESNIMRLHLIKFCVYPEYVILFLQSFQGLKELQKNAKHAVNQSSINQQDVKSTAIALPPLDEQKEIVQRVENLFKLADQIEQRYQKARVYVDKLPQSILAKAFRGELVPQDPNDEPASVLLERIRAERQQKEEKSGGKSKGRGQQRGRKPRPEVEPDQLGIPGVE